MRVAEAALLRFQVCESPSLPGRKWHACRLSCLYLAILGTSHRSDLDTHRRSFGISYHTAPCEGWEWCKSHLCIGRMYRLRQCQWQGLPWIRNQGPCQHWLLGWQLFVCEGQVQQAEPTHSFCRPGRNGLLGCGLIPVFPVCRGGRNFLQLLYSCPSSTLQGPTNHRSIGERKTCLA